MDPLDQWQQQISNWYKQRKHDQVEVLSKLINDPPLELWGTELSSQQTLALEYWLDGCVHLYQYHLQLAQFNASYAYLCLAQAKLEHLISRAEVDQNIRLYCSEKLQHIILLIMDFCKNQQDEAWQCELRRQLNGHNRFCICYPLSETPIPVLKPSTK
ncbi:hypothetical protein [Vibrio rarus]|uniref:hypothetical protein n=1 Tax=Vibrio rarus TaxID=413403 RepID=UPI0021C28ED8|nr:hypothetical protein [Vibrio rarus]